MQEQLELMRDSFDEELEKRVDAVEAEEKVRSCVCRCCSSFARSLLSRSSPWTLFRPVYPRTHPPRTPHLLCIYLTFCLLSAFQDLRQKYKLELGRKHDKDFNRLHRKYHQERDDICSAHRQELKYKDKQVEVWHFQYLLHKIQ
jgi:hypothetical protein